MDGRQRSNPRFASRSRHLPRLTGSGFVARTLDRSDARQPASHPKGAHDHDATRLPPTHRRGGRLLGRLPLDAGARIAADREPGRADRARARRRSRQACRDPRGRHRRHDVGIRARESRIRVHASRGAGSGRRTQLDHSARDTSGSDRRHFTDLRIRSRALLERGPGAPAESAPKVLGYCREFGVPLEVEVNTSRSAMLSNANANGGRPIEMRQAVNDTRGAIAELLAKALDRGALDQEITKEIAIASSHSSCSTVTSRRTSSTRAHRGPATRGARAAATIRVRSVIRCRSTSCSTRTCGTACCSKS